MVIDKLSVHNKSGRINMAMFREYYLRYRRGSEGEEITFSKDDMRRVETFAHQIELKLMRARKSFKEVFVDRLRMKDGAFAFEEVRNVVQYNLQMEESLD